MDKTWRRRKDENKQSSRPNRIIKKDPWVLVVSEEATDLDHLSRLADNAIDDVNEQQIYAYNASRRMSRDNIQAVGLLTSKLFDIGVKFDPEDPFYDRNISLYRRNLLSEQQLKNFSKTILIRRL